MPSLPAIAAPSDVQYRCRIYSIPSVLVWELLSRPAEVTEHPSLGRVLSRLSLDVPVGAKLIDVTTLCDGDLRFKVYHPEFEICERGASYPVHRVSTAFPQTELLREEPAVPAGVGA